MFYVCLTDIQLIKPDRHMSELGQIACKNITSTLLHLLVLLCELYGMYTYTHTHPPTPTHTPHTHINTHTHTPTPTHPHTHTRNTYLDLLIASKLLNPCIVINAYFLLNQPYAHTTSTTISSFFTPTCFGITCHLKRVIIHVFIVAPCILKSTYFTHQQRHYLLIWLNF